jgi:hypothetical protein
MDLDKPFKVALSEDGTDIGDCNMVYVDINYYLKKYDFTWQTK